MNFWKLAPTAILTEESDSPVIAKTCGCRTNKRKVTYGFLNDSHSLCLDKKDLISAQLEACEKLSKYVSDPYDKMAVEKEIRELRMALDLMT
jgi:hypothetical protein